MTKRLGTGVIGTALKKSRASEESLHAAVESMRTLNREAGELALKYEIHAATDITGFGLLGHAREMATGSGVSLVIDSSQVEFLPGALDAAREGYLPGGLKRNIEFISGCVEFSDGIPEPVRNLLYDPQTSGGLLVSCSAPDAPRLLNELLERHIPAREIGTATEKTKPLISVH